GGGALARPTPESVLAASRWRSARVRCTQILPETVGHPSSVLAGDMVRQRRSQFALQAVLGLLDLAQQRLVLVQQHFRVVALFLGRVGILQVQVVYRPVQSVPDRLSIA